VDDAAQGNASLGFRVVGDGKRLFDSGVMYTNTPAKTVSLDLRGIKTLLLQVNDAGDGIGYDHADWATHGSRWLPERRRPFRFLPKKPCSLRRNLRQAADKRRYDLWLPPGESLHLPDSAQGERP